MAAEKSTREKGYSMDRLRPQAPRRRRVRRLIVTVLLSAALGAGWVLTARFQEAPPTLESRGLLIAEVKRGDLPLRIRGYGVLLPVEMRLVTAETGGRVERILLEPGAEVESDTILLKLSNRELEQSLLEAEWQLRAAEAEYEDLKARLEGQMWEQKARVAAAEADYLEEQMEAERNAELAPQGLIPAVDLRRAETRAKALRTRYEVELQRLETLEESSRSQLAVQQAKLEQARALYSLRKHQLETLEVKAQIDGILQRLHVEVGQYAAPGTPLAVVAMPWPLKAEVRIPDVQAKDVRVGLPAQVDTRTAVVKGRVARIAPTAQQGVVLVDIALDGPAPQGARPDLTVDAQILVEELKDVLFLPRPSFGTAGNEAPIFRLTENGRCAQRVTVSFGPASVDSIVVRQGLRQGDRVILSDMSRWYDHDLVCFFEE